MWTATSRAEHNRAGLRFASDLTDAEWAVLQPLLPSRSPVGRRPRWPVREIVNAIFYVLRGGVSWRMLPPCFPPRQTVYGWFAAWRDAGVWQTINHHLVMLDRERSGREASPSAAVIDSQSVKDTAYAAARVTNATSIAIQIVRKIPGQVGFEVHPRRWVVERCFAWLNRNRRLAKDFEASIASATAFLYAASAMMLIRRLARSA